MKLIVLPVLLCLSMGMHAQIHWAIGAGGQTSTARYIRQDRKISTESVAGLKAGLLAKVYFDTKTAFVSGLSYNVRGFAVKTLPGDTQKTYRLNYIDIPLMIQFDLGAGRGQGLYCKAGPVIGIGLSGKETYAGMNGQTVHNNAPLSLTGNHLGLFDASLHVALGYGVTQKLFLEAGYGYGIGNINNEVDGPNIKSRVASLCIGYFFN